MINLFSDFHPPFYSNIVYFQTLSIFVELRFLLWTLYRIKKKSLQTIWSHFAAIFDWQPFIYCLYNKYVVNKIDKIAEIVQCHHVTFEFYHFEFSSHSHRHRFFIQNIRLTLQNNFKIFFNNISIQIDVKHTVSIDGIFKRMLICLLRICI